MATSIADARVRLREQSDRWGVVIEEVQETASSLIAYGERRGTAVVMKVVKSPGDEWRSGAVLEAFAGLGSVRVQEHTGGALLLERLRPGHSLIGLSQRGEDEAAIDILAGIVATMAPSPPPSGCPTVTEWAGGFDRYLAANEEGIPRTLVLRAQETFTQLARSQRSPRLLHGDLQHSNVLFDEDRGWTAIDPKGVIGELEYELGAAFRNPWEAPLLFSDSRTVERRLLQFTTALRLDATRILGWAFAQAVLSAIWDWEDGAPVDVESPVLSVARTLETMLCDRYGWAPSQCLNRDGGSIPVQFPYACGTPAGAIIAPLTDG